MVTKESPSNADGSVGQQRCGRQGEGGKAEPSRRGPERNDGRTRSVGVKKQSCLVEARKFLLMYQEKEGGPSANWSLFSFFFFLGGVGGMNKNV